MVDNQRIEQDDGQRRAVYSVRLDWCIYTMNNMYVAFPPDYAWVVHVTPLV